MTVHLIMDRRQTGRTQRLIEMAEVLLLQNDGFTAVFVVPTYRQAQLLTTRLLPRFDLFDVSTATPEGLSRQRTIIDIAHGLGDRLRGRLTQGWDSPMPPPPPPPGPNTKHAPKLSIPMQSHKTFAFIDDATSMRAADWELLMDDLTVHGIAVSAVVVESRV